MATDPSNSLRGIAYMFAAMFVLSCMDVLSKYLATRFPVPEILFIRYCVFFVFAVLISGPRKLPAILRSRNPKLQILRGIIIGVEVGLFIFAFRHMPLADVHAIAGAAPLFVTALAVPLLGEHVGRRRWTAVIIGFIGLLVILRPGAGVFHPVGFVVLFGALLWALYQIVTRLVSADDPATSLIYMAAVGAAGSGLIVPFVWVTPDWGGLCLLLLLGLIGSVGHYLFIKAYQAAEASLLQPFHYTALLWATLFGYVFFGDFPDNWTICGGLIVAGGGLYALYRAHVRHTVP